MIDGFQFARAGEEIRGTLGLEDLSRLTEMGVQSAQIGFVIRGVLNERGKPGLRVTADIRLAMTCQRCLGAVDVPLKVDSELELAASEVEIETAEDEIDRVLASPAMDVVALVEDEVILALPMVPRHEACAGKAAAAADEAGSPFAALAGLRSKH